MLHRSRRAVRRRLHVLIFVAVALSIPAATAAQPDTPPTPPPQTDRSAADAERLQLGLDDLAGELRAGLEDAAIRLPLAALFGAALALRPRRTASSPRDPAVVETQIVLAIIGALIMIVVGASLARAFGIAGAASLIRYRAKIEDPKDAVVMLAALSVGLASGVGLFGVAAGATLFLVALLSVFESFESRVRTFLLTVKLGDKTSERRKDVEKILQRARTNFELRTTAESELSYLVTANESLTTDRLSAALAALESNGKAQIEWKEQPKVRPLADKEAD